ncbi:MAG: MerR family transcriptional regulator [Dehalococcoidia bacterium]|nr:MerR family transcriptional regulator [Dehalococcoidia bacterium]
MKISELSRQSGIPLPTLKFYLREGLLPPGTLTQPNQADYSESHLRRAELIRALREVAGLSIAKIRAVVDALEQGEATYEVMGQAVDALGGEAVSAFTLAQAQAATDIDTLLTELGLPIRDESLARHQIIAAFATVRTLLFPDVAAEFLMPYYLAAEKLARLEKAATPGLFELPPEQALEKAMLGLALFEPILVAFRRLAHERIVLEVLAPEASPPARR